MKIETRWMRARWIAAVVAASVTCGFAGSAFGQAAAYPNRPVRVVIPFPVGGGAEGAARLVATHLGRTLGQSFVIEPRPGGNTMIATDAVAKSAADGYTVLVCGSSTMTSNPILFAGKMPYDTQRDFTPVGMVSRVPYFLAIPASIPANNIQELLALARAKPGSLTYVSNGNGTTNHLGYELLARAGGASMTHVPYKGFAQAMPDVLAGRVSTIMADFFIVAPAAKAGQLRLLAVTSGERSALMPELPTVAEQGVPGYDVTTWFAMFAPAAVPADIVAKLGAEMRRYLVTPEARDAYRQLGQEPSALGPDELRAVIRSESEKFGRVIREANIRPD